MLLFFPLWSGCHISPSLLSKLFISDNDLSSKAWKTAHHFGMFHPPLAGSLVASAAGDLQAWVRGCGCARDLEAGKDKSVLRSSCNAFLFVHMKLFNDVNIWLKRESFIKNGMRISLYVCSIKAVGGTAGVSRRYSSDRAYVEGQGHCLFFMQGGKHGCAPRSL